MSQAAAAGLAGCARRATPSFAVLVLLLAPWLLRGQLSASASRPRDCVARSELTSCSAESTSEQVPCVGAEPPASQLARWAAASQRRSRRGRCTGSAHIDTDNCRGACLLLWPHLRIPWGGPQDRRWASFGSGCWASPAPALVGVNGRRSSGHTRRKLLCSLDFFARPVP